MQAAPGPRSEWETRYCTFSCSLSPHSASLDPSWILAHIKVWGKDWEVEGQVGPQGGPCVYSVPMVQPPASISPASPVRLGAAVLELGGQARVGKQGFRYSREGGNTPAPPFQALLGKGSSSLMKLIDNVHFFLEAFENCQGW